MTIFYLSIIPVNFNLPLSGDMFKQSMYNMFQLKWHPTQFLIQQGPFIGSTIANIGLF